MSRNGKRVRVDVKTKCPLRKLLSADAIKIKKFRSLKSKEKILKNEIGQTVKFLGPPHGTTPDAVITNRNKKLRSFKSKENIHKYEDDLDSTVSNHKFSFTKYAIYSFPGITHISEENNLAFKICNVQSPHRSLGHL